MMSEVIPFPARRPIVFRQTDYDENVFEDEMPPVLFDEQEDHEDIALFERMYETSMDE